MRKEAPWWGVALRLWGQEAEPSCPFTRYSSQPLEPCTCCFTHFFPLFSLLHTPLPFAFIFFSTCPLSFFSPSLPLIPTLRRYPMFSRYTWPRGIGTNICFHLHSLLALSSFNCKIMKCRNEWNVIISLGTLLFPKELELISKAREWLSGRQLEAISIYRDIMNIKNVNTC